MVKSLIISLAAAVFVLEFISQKGNSGWQYLASYGALRYTLSLVNRSVLTTGKAKAEERRSHSECILSRDTRMWPRYYQAARIRCNKDLISTGFSTFSGLAQTRYGLQICTLSHVTSALDPQATHTLPQPSCYLLLNAAHSHV